MTSPIFVLFLSLFSQTARQAYTNRTEEIHYTVVYMSLNFRLQTEGNVYRNSDRQIT
jgi:hypothetical protein